MNEQRARAWDEAFRAALNAINSNAVTYALRVAATSPTEARARLRDIVTVALQNQYALAAAAAQDTADPADGLTSETGTPLTVEEAARYYAWALEDPDPYRRGFATALALAARQRPTRQADTDRAVVEAVLAMADEWDTEHEFTPECMDDDGYRCRRCVDIRALRAIAAASEPTSGHHHHEAGM